MSLKFATTQSRVLQTGVFEWVNSGAKLNFNFMVETLRHKNELPMYYPMVQVNNLRKRFGKTVALQEINLSVAAGSVLGVLGPNGAGKTTTINCLTTLLKPDGGQATIAGYDVITQPAAVRSLIGVTGQFAAVDEELTARENLVLFGRLMRLSAAEAARRATELLEQFGLLADGKRRVKEFSGGMRRRLDLAVSIVAEPLVLFLDEPTTGLDPRRPPTTLGCGARTEIAGYNYISHNSVFRRG
jgi:ABC-type transporter Mla maintaining outer membrane lipid asymmetry ATPase subunit MlaF